MGMKMGRGRETLKNIIVEGQLFLPRRDGIFDSLFFSLSFPSSMSLIHLGIFSQSLIFGSEWEGSVLLRVGGKLEEWSCSCLLAMQGTSSSRQGENSPPNANVWANQDHAKQYMKVENVSYVFQVQERIDTESESKNFQRLWPDRHLWRCPFWGLNHWRSVPLSLWLIELLKAHSERLIYHHFHGWTRNGRRETFIREIH